MTESLHPLEAERLIRESEEYEEWFQKYHAEQVYEEGYNAWRDERLEDGCSPEEVTREAYDEEMAGEPPC